VLTELGIKNFHFVRKRFPFTQVHFELNERLCALTREYLNPEKNDIIFDLFCGDANLSYSWQKDVSKVCGIDNDRLAIDEAKSKSNENTRYLAVDIKRGLHQLIREKNNPY